MHLSFEMVIHTHFGGFSLTDEIVERLRARGCPWIDQIAKASPSGPWYAPAQDGDEFRRDEHLVAVVKELEEELESRVENVKSWRDRAAIEQDLLHGLKVVTVHIDVEILDDDGKESVRVHGSAS